MPDDCYADKNSKINALIGSGNDLHDKRLFNEAILAYGKVVTMLERQVPGPGRDLLLASIHMECAKVDEKLLWGEKYSLVVGQLFSRHRPSRFMDYNIMSSIKNWPSQRESMLKHYGAAIGILENTEPSGRTGGLLLSAYKERAALRYSAEDYNGAIEDCSKALSIKENSSIYKIRADAKAALKNYRGAAKDYSAAIRLLENMPRRNSRDLAIQKIYASRIAVLEKLNDKGGIANDKAALEIVNARILGRAQEEMNWIVANTRKDNFKLLREEKKPETCL